jgi:hypothetical protein
MYKFIHVYTALLYVCTLYINACTSVKTPLLGPLNQHFNHVIALMIYHKSCYAYNVENKLPYISL